MRAHFGRGKYANVLYFDEEATELILKYARKKHKSFKYIVIQALKLGAKKAGLYHAEDWRNK